MHAPPSSPWCGGGDAVRTRVYGLQIPSLGLNKAGYVNVQQPFVRACRCLGMPRYFFNIVRGKTVIPDPEGDVLRSDTAARRHAFMIAREMIKERHNYRGCGIERWAFEITDKTGRHVAKVQFSDV